MGLTRLKKCDAWLKCFRRDGGMFDEFKAEPSLRILIGGGSPAANVITDEGRLECQVRNQNGDWYDLRNSDVEADLRRCYYKVLLLSVAGDVLAMLDLGPVDCSMENSDCNDL